MRPSLFRRVLDGYAAILKPVLFILALLAASAGLSFAIAWPLWFFATGNSLAYSLSVLAVIAAAGTALFLGSRARKKAAGAGSETEGKRGRPIAFAIFIVSWICIFAAGVYFSALLAVRGKVYIGAPLLAVLLFLLGLAAWGAKRKK